MSGFDGYVDSANYADGSGFMADGYGADFGGDGGGNDGGGNSYFWNALLACCFL